MRKCDIDHVGFSLEGKSKHMIWTWLVDNPPARKEKNKKQQTKIPKISKKGNDHNWLPPGWPGSGLLSNNNKQY